MAKNEEKTNDSCNYFRGVRMNKRIDQFADDLFEKISQTNTYINYVAQQEKVKNDEVLKSKIRELRELNLKLQSTEDSEELFREQEYIENRYSELCEDERVYMFIQAESEFTLALQHVYNKVLEKIPFIE